MDKHIWRKKDVKAEIALPVNPLPVRYYRRQWQDIYSIVRSSWWGRAWVYQEFVTYKRAYFLLGPDCFIRGHRLQECLLSFFAIDLETVHQEIDRVIALAKHNYTLVPGSLPRMNIMLTQQADLQMKILQDLSPLIKRSQTSKALAEFVLRSKATWNGPVNLSVLLRHLRNCQSSEFRDKVYAFLGLTHPAYGIVPDYTSRTTVEEFLVDIARRIIETERNLGIIADAVKSRGLSYGSKLPSWVPDWTSPEDDEARNFRKILELPVDFQPLGPYFPPSLPTVYGKHLKVEGTHLACFNSCGIETYKSWREFNVNASGILAFNPPPGMELIVRTTNSAAITDELWLIYGYQFPLVLKKLGDLYLIVGEAMIWQRNLMHPSKVVFGDYEYSSALRITII